MKFPSTVKNVLDVSSKIHPNIYFSQVYTNYNTVHRSTLLSVKKGLFQPLNKKILHQFYIQLQQRRHFLELPKNRIEQRLIIPSYSVDDCPIFNGNDGIYTIK